MDEQHVPPNLKNFISSIRDIGYSFEIAVADIIDNSISAKANTIEIETDNINEIYFGLLDNGSGMNEEELVEAMRLASKSSLDKREKSDLGRFGLGLKTSSFSQCRKLTVLSKKNERIVARQWNLDYIVEKADWILLKPVVLSQYPMFDKLQNLESGTLVVWESIDRVNSESFIEIIDNMRRHLSITFHRFMDGSIPARNIKIILNNNPVEAFNPFNTTHPATQQIPNEIIKTLSSDIIVTPYILPHHSKISKQDYKRYGTQEGYLKSQGFYLYRENRLLMYGTWWRLHKLSSAHQLIRIKIDISNDQDSLWGIDVKKSVAKPTPEIKTELKRIISQIKNKGKRIYSRRGHNINAKKVIPFWSLMPASEDGCRFCINKDNPVFKYLLESFDGEQKYNFKIFITSLEKYLPLELIQAQLIDSPHSIKQYESLSETEVREYLDKLNDLGLPEEYIQSVLKTELQQ